MLSTSHRPTGDIKGSPDADERREHDLEDSDAVFGGSVERARMEKHLLRRLDARHSILIIIYILNYVCAFSFISERLGFAYVALD
jgi:hypothetical protein